MRFIEESDSGVASATPFFICISIIPKVFFNKGKLAVSERFFLLLEDHFWGFPAAFVMVDNTGVIQ